MYHKFNLHFSDSQITFNPIRQSFLCWLKRHSQANSFAAAATSLSLSSSPPVSHPNFSDSASFPPLVGHSYLFYYSPSVFSTHQLSLHFYRQWKSHIAELTVCKCPFFVCCASTQITALSEAGPGVLSEQFTLMKGKGRVDLCMREPYIDLNSITHLCHFKTTLQLFLLLPICWLITAWEQGCHIGTKLGSKGGRGKVKNTD